MTKSTTDYSIFNKHECNRNIDEFNLKKIITSLQVRNLLQFKPILVDKNFNVIDGNHRLEAAKKLNIPIFYQIDEKATDEDIILLNSNQKKWVIEDYINYHIVKGNINYIKLKQFCQSYKLNDKIALLLLNRTRGKQFYENVRIGKYIFPDDKQMVEIKENYQDVQDIIKYISEKYCGNKYFLSSITFLKALISFSNFSDVNMRIFLSKIEYKLNLIKKCASENDYVYLFKTIYNWHNQSPINV